MRVLVCHVAVRMRTSNGTKSDEPYHRWNHLSRQSQCGRSPGSGPGCLVSPCVIQRPVRPMRPGRLHPAGFYLASDAQLLDPEHVFTRELGSPSPKWQSDWSSHARGFNSGGAARFQIYWYSTEGRGDLVLFISGKGAGVDSCGVVKNTETCSGVDL